MNKPLITQPSAAPTRKVAACGIGGVVGYLLSIALLRYGIDLPPEIQATLESWIVGGITLAASVISAYMTRERAE